MKSLACLICFSSQTSQLVVSEGLYLSLAEVIQRYRLETRDRFRCDRFDPSRPERCELVPAQCSQLTVGETGYGIFAELRESNRLEGLEAAFGKLLQLITREASDLLCRQLGGLRR